MGGLIRTTLGNDVVRGRVSKIINGDTFDIKVTEAASGNVDQYDAIERILIISISTEEEGSMPEGLSAYPPVEETAVPNDPGLPGYSGGEELDGTVSEASMESGRVNPTEYDNVRTKEDLEAQIKGRTVDCVVRSRESNGRLICDVIVL